MKRLIPFLITLITLLFVVSGSSIAGWAERELFISRGISVVDFVKKGSTRAVLYEKGAKTYIAEFNGLSWEIEEVPDCQNSGSLFYDVTGNVYVACYSNGLEFYLHIKDSSTNQWQREKVDEFTSSYTPAGVFVAVEETGTIHYIYGIDNVIVHLRKSGGSWVKGVSDFSGGYVYDLDVSLKRDSSGNERLFMAYSINNGSAPDEVTIKGWDGSTWTTLHTESRATPVHIDSYGESYVMFFKPQTARDFKVVQGQFPNPPTTQVEFDENSGENVINFTRADVTFLTPPAFRVYYFDYFGFQSWRIRYRNSTDLGIAYDAVLNQFNSNYVDLYAIGDEIVYESSAIGAELRHLNTQTDAGGIIDSDYGFVDVLKLFGGTKDDLDFVTGTNGNLYYGQHKSGLTNLVRIDSYYSFLDHGVGCNGSKFVIYYAGFLSPFGYQNVVIAVFGNAWKFYVLPGANYSNTKDVEASIDCNGNLHVFTNFDDSGSNLLNHYVLDTSTETWSVEVIGTYSDRFTFFDSRIKNDGQIDLVLGIISASRITELISYTNSGGTWSTETIASSLAALHADGRFSDKKYPTIILVDYKTPPDISTLTLFILEHDGTSWQRKEVYGPFHPSITIYYRFQNILAFDVSSSGKTFIVILDPLTGAKKFFRDGSLEDIQGVNISLSNDMLASENSILVVNQTINYLEYTETLLQYDFPVPNAGGGGCGGCNIAGFGGLLPGYVFLMLLIVFRLLRLSKDLKKGL